jgi:hypothetical protein
MLAAQAAGETEEQRRKRMAQMQTSQMLGPMGSLAATSLFGMTSGSPKSAGY